MDMKRTELDSNQNMQYLAISQAGDGFSTSCRTLTRVVKRTKRDVEKCVFVHCVCGVQFFKITMSDRLF